MKKIFKFIFILFGIFIAISVVSGIYQGVTGKDLGTNVSNEYQTAYNERFNYYMSLSTSDLVAIGLLNVIDEQNNPSRELAYEWCDGLIVADILTGVQFTDEQLRGATDGCTDAFMERA